MKRYTSEDPFPEVQGKFPYRLLLEARKDAWSLCRTTSSIMAKGHSQWRGMSHSGASHSGNSQLPGHLQMTLLQSTQHPAGGHSVGLGPVLRSPCLQQALHTAMEKGRQNSAVSQNSPSPPLPCLLLGTSGLCLESPLRRLMFHILAGHLGLKAREQPLHSDPQAVPDTLQRPP